MKFVTMPQGPLDSPFCGGVTFLARRTYHVDKLALNREMWIFAVPARG